MAQRSMECEARSNNCKRVPQSSVATRLRPSCCARPVDAIPPDFAEIARHDDVSKATLCARIMIVLPTRIVNEPNDPVAVQNLFSD